MSLHLIFVLRWCECAIIERAQNPLLPWCWLTSEREERPASKAFKATELTPSLFLSVCVCMLAWVGCYSKARFLIGSWSCHFSTRMSGLLLRWPIIGENLELKLLQFPAPVVLLGIEACCMLWIHTLLIFSLHACLQQRKKGKESKMDKAEKVQKGFMKITQNYPQGAKKEMLYLSFIFFICMLS